MVQQIRYHHGTREEMEKGEKTEMMLDLGPKESVETHQKDDRGGKQSLRY